MTVHSVLEGLTPSDIDTSGGFPLLVRQQALPADYYEALAGQFPGLDVVMGDRALENNKAYRLSASNAIGNDGVAADWQAFVDYHTSQAFFDEFRALFADAIAATHPGFEDNFGKPLSAFEADRRDAGSKGVVFNAHSPLKRFKRHADVMMDTQFSFNSPVREQSKVRGAHLDNPSKMYTGLLYFQLPGDDAGGDLEFYRLRDGVRPKASRSYADDEVECFRTVRYQANTLVMFVNSPYSLHGVTPRAVTEQPRRYMNIIGECYGGRVPDFFTAPELRRPYWLRALSGAVTGHAG